MYWAVAISKRMRTIFTSLRRSTTSGKSVAIGFAFVTRACMCGTMRRWRSRPENARASIDSALPTESEKLWLAVQHHQLPLARPWKARRHTWLSTDVFPP